MIRQQITYLLMNLAKESSLLPTENLPKYRILDLNLIL
jgi:hypothetical protein